MPFSGASLNISRIVRPTPSGKSPRHFECPICLDICSFPLTCKVCRNKFCVDCLYNSRNNNCPICRTKNTEYVQPEHSFIVEMNELEVHCVNAKNGCSQKRSLLTYEFHDIVCKWTERNSAERSLNLEAKMEDKLLTSSDVYLTIGKVIQCHCKKPGMIYTECCDKVICQVCYDDSHKGENGGTLCLEVGKHYSNGSKMFFIGKTLSDFIYYDLTRLKCAVEMSRDSGSIKGSETLINSALMILRPSYIMLQKRFTDRKMTEKLNLKFAQLFLFNEPCQEVICKGATNCKSTHDNQFVKKDEAEIQDLINQDFFTKKNRVSDKRRETVSQVELNELTELNEKMKAEIKDEDEKIEEKKKLINNESLQSSSANSRASAPRSSRFPQLGKCSSILVCIFISLIIGVVTLYLMLS